MLIQIGLKYIYIFGVKSATTAVVMECLRHVFARFRVPVMVVSDYGIWFVSSEVRQFLGTNDILHTTSAPYPASNKLAERVIQIIKQGLYKMTHCNIADWLSRLLFSYRTTPHSATGVTPAALLLGRKPQTRF